MSGSISKHRGSKFEKYKILKLEISQEDLSERDKVNTVPTFKSHRKSFVLKINKPTKRLYTIHEDDADDHSETPIQSPISPSNDRGGEISKILLKLLLKNTVRSFAAGKCSKDDSYKTEKIQHEIEVGNSLILTRYRCFKNGDPKQIRS